MAAFKAMRDSDEKFDAMMEEEAQTRAAEEEELLPPGMTMRIRKK